MRYLDRLQPLALLALRVVIGVIMVGHGYQKVFGGFSHVQDLVHRIGFPEFFAYLLAATEFGGGILMMLGLLTRFVAVAMLIDMSVAIWKVHWPNGLIGRAGYEFPLCMAVIAFSLIFFGGGPLSLDHLLTSGAPKPKK